MARTQLLLSATEKDRPGLVAELTGFIAAHGGNVEDSRVAVLGGHAGLFFLVSGEAEQVASIARDLDAFERDTGIRAVIRPIASPAPTVEETRTPNYELVASAIDHEGILHAITDVVRAHGANIVELETTTESAPMTGSPLFAMRMRLALGKRQPSVDRLRTALVELAHAEAIDLEISPVPARELAVG